MTAYRETPTAFGWTMRPTLEEAMQSINGRNLADFREVVFCGFGEPFCRFEDMARLCHL